MVSANKPQKNSPAIVQVRSNNVSNAELKRLLEKHIRKGQVAPDRNMESIGHKAIARNEPITNPVPNKVKVKTGTNARHDQRGTFKLRFAVSMDHLPSIFLENVIEHISIGRLAGEMGSKVGAQLMTDIFATLDPKSFAMVPRVWKTAREHVFSILTENGDAIAASLWEVQTPSVDTVKQAIARKHRVLKLFTNREELERVEEEITRRTRCPGFLPIADSISVLARQNGHGGLTFDDMLSKKVTLTGKAEYREVSLLEYLQMVGEQKYVAWLENKQKSAYQDMAMSNHRIGDRVLNDSGKYPIPQAALEPHRVTGASVIYEKKGKQYRAPIVLLGPLALQIFGLEDGTIVAVLANGNLVGLSEEEQAFLRPQYEVKYGKKEETALEEDRKILARRG